MIFTFVVLVISILLLVFYVMYLKSRVESLESSRNYYRRLLDCEKERNSELLRENREMIEVMWSNAKFLSYQSECYSPKQVCDSSREFTSCS